MDYVHIASGGSSSLLFGNAPLQGASWDKIVRETGVDRLESFYRVRGINALATDLRQYVAEIDDWGKVRNVRNYNDREHVVVDLGSESLLEDLYVHGACPSFRISDYRPDCLQSYHSKGRHIYLISRKFLESDVVISLPKLKTHEQVGLTCCLKGFVGITSQKICLPHHRARGPLQGGDEYPNGGLTISTYSRLRDIVSGLDPGTTAFNCLKVLDRTLGKILRASGAVSAGAWHGNDTTWRMALDVARIAFYADRFGIMHSEPQRIHLALVDGIVGGEGNGPLKPRPVQSGVILFSDDLSTADLVAARIMGYHPNSIPIVRESFGLVSYPISRKSGATSIIVNGRSVTNEEIGPLGGRSFAEPSGWIGRMRERRCG